MDEKLGNKRIFLSIIVVGILVALLWKVCPIMFQNNDDKFLLYMIAGYTTGTPNICTVFGGFLWAGFINLFYKVYAGITWYTIITLAAIVISIIIICRTMVETNVRQQIIIGFVVFIALFFITLCYFATAIQYTVTAAYVGVAGVCASLLADWTDSKKKRIAYTVISSLLVLTSYSIRKQMGLVTMSCIAIVLFFMLIKKERAYAIKAAVVLVAVFAITYISNLAFEKYTGLDQFNKDYSIVQRWIDYPHIDIADDTDGVYESVGWDQELYDAATEWFFLDERVSTENIQVINNASSNESITFSERMDRAWAAINNKQMVNVQVAIWCIVLLIANITLIRCKKTKNEILNLLCADALFIFFVVVAVYFCFLQGRFPLRVYQALVIIYFAPSLAIALKLLNTKECNKTSALIAAVMLLSVPACYKGYASGSMLYQAKLATHDADRIEMISQVTNLEEYAAENKDNLYVYDYELSQPSAPFVNFEKNKPYNILFWGGWTYDSPVYYAQLEANGRDSLKPEDLIDRNVYLCGKQIDQVIYDYMESVFGELDVEVIDNVGDIIVYRYITK